MPSENFRRHVFFTHSECRINIQKQGRFFRCKTFHYRTATVFSNFNFSINVNVDENTTKTAANN